MSLYQGINWLLCVTTAAMIFVTIKRRRYTLIRPVGIVTLLFHVLIQWSGAMRSGEIEQFLPDPLPYLVLLHGFPMAGLVLLWSSFNGKYEQTWQRIMAVPYRPDARVWSTLAALSGILVLSYLAFVSFETSGFYTLLTDPGQASTAREESLKLLDNRLVVYAFWLFMNAVAPLLAVTTSYLLRQDFREGRFVRAGVCFAMIICLLISVSLPGARSPAVAIVLVIVMSSFLTHKALLKGRLIVSLCLIVLLLASIPTVLTVLREGRELAWHELWLTFAEGVVPRVLLIPTDTGLWHVHYAQTNGFFGVGAIPKLAWLFDIEPKWAPNIIGLLYASNGLDTTSANTCFVFSYYSYFGLWSFPFVVFATFLLDTVVCVYRTLSDALLLPLASSVAVCSISFISSDYTVSLLSGGFLFLVLLGLLLDRLVVNRAAGQRSVKNAIWSAS